MSFRPPHASDLLFGDAFESGPRYGAWRITRLIERTPWIETFEASPALQPTDDDSLYLLRAPRTDLHGEESKRAHMAIVREALLSLRVRSPHLPTVVDSSLNDEPWLVLPGVIGLPLGEVSLAEWSLPQKLWTVRQVATALDCLSRSGYLHGTLQPSCIRVTGLGHVTLTDLGFARELGTAECADTNSIFVGSVEYAAPEMFGSEQPLTAAADVYSLGGLLFELLAGQSPFAEYDTAELPAVKRMSRAPRLCDANPDMPDSLAVLVDRMLARQPLRRPRARDVVENLAAIEIANFALWKVLAAG